MFDTFVAGVSTLHTIAEVGSALEAEGFAWGFLQSGMRDIRVRFGNKMVFGI